VKLSGAAIPQGKLHFFELTCRNRREKFKTTKKRKVVEICHFGEV
jgi:hypothetical protein